jgi:hypothetical protein
MSRGIVKTKKVESAEVREDLRCPFCGVLSANAYLLDLNHGPNSPRSQMTKQCVSQMLITNHITFTLRRLREAPTMGTKQSVVASMRRQLEEEVEAGRGHNIDVDALLAQFAGETCPRCIRGEHERCDEDTTWSDIVEGSVDCGCWMGGHKP